MKMQEQLKQIGLAGNEVKVYLELLKLKGISGNELARKVGLDRSVTYNVLNNLIEKGLVNYVIKEGKKFFSGANPENLLRPVKEKERLLKEIIPKLKKICKIELEKKKVEVYEGKEGLKNFHQDVLKNKEILLLNVTGRIYQVLEFSVSHLIKEYNKRKVRIIAIEEAKKTPVVKGLEKAEFKFLPRKYSNYATTFIYGNKVAIQVIIEKPFIVVIENKEIAKGYQKDFEFIWERL